jgi:hypothetical protein
MAKYKALLMKIPIDSPSNEKAKVNFNLLCDVQIMLGLATILSLL